MKLIFNKVFKEYWTGDFVVVAEKCSINKYVRQSHISKISLGK